MPQQHLAGFCALFVRCPQCWAQPQGGVAAAAAFRDGWVGSGGLFGLRLGRIARDGVPSKHAYTHADKCVAC